MSTSIASLGVDVTLELSKMDAQFRELQTKTSKSMAQLKGQFRAASRDANGSLGSIGKGGGGGAFGKIGSKLAGDAAGNLAGIGGRGGDIIAGAGPAGAVAAGVALVLKFHTAVANWAKESGNVDDATISVMRYGESLTAIGKGALEMGKEISIGVLGALNQVGEFIGSGFNRDAVAEANESERAALEQEAKLADLRKKNNPEKLAAIRAQITQFQRDQKFAAGSPKDRQNMLTDEIGGLKTKEAAARADRRFLDADTIKLERMKKEADLAKIITDQSEEQRKNAEAITLSAMKRKDAADEETKRELDKQTKQTKQTAKDALDETLKQTRDRMSSLHNPFQGAGVTGFGSASSGGTQALQEGNKLQAQMLKALQAMEQNTEYLTRGLN
jgi:hypothetical protein